MRTMRPGFFARTLTTTARRANAPWRPGPAPPRLPKEEQEIFEKLQQQSTGAFSLPRSPTSATEAAPETSGSEAVKMQQSTTEQMLEMLREKARLQASGDGEELHPNVRRGAAPEFQGDTNPKTGEVGGPKNEPLRWGHGSDWSYNGRVTDF